MAEVKKKGMLTGVDEVGLVGADLAGGVVDELSTLAVIAWLA